MKNNMRVWVLINLFTSFTYKRVLRTKVPIAFIVTYVTCFKIGGGVKPEMTNVLMKASLN